MQRRGNYGLLLLLCGSFAHGNAPDSVYAQPQGEAYEALDSGQGEAPAAPIAPAMPAMPAAPAQAAPLDSIPQGFASQLMKSQQPAAIDTPAVPPAVQPAPVPSSSSAASSSSAVAAYKCYEDYLDSIIIFARSILPGKQRLETQKAIVNAEAPQPKSEYERQQDYDARIAGFEKEKQKRIKALEKEYKIEEKNRVDKLRGAINSKADIQPEWAGILKRDTTVEGYVNRSSKLADKIFAMDKATAKAMEILANLDLLGKGDLEAMDNKNRIYMARLARAKELMQDYVIQDQARVLGTERRKPEMALGAYDADKEEFELSMNDANSETVPFDYVGKVKISPKAAQEIDRKTDNFTVSIDYINYPFILDDQKLYPGTKRAYVFYKDQEFPNAGVFRNVPGFESAPGYMEWALRADSLIRGALAARNLDSMHAMKKFLPKAVPAGTFWERNKNIARVALFGLAAASAGAAIYKNSDADSKKKDLQKTFKSAEAELISGSQAEYEQIKKEYNDGKSGLRSAENMRNGFYISAGALGFAGVIALCF